MLRSLRTFASSFVGIIVILGLAASFIFTGQGGQAGGSGGVNTQTAVSVAGENVSRGEVLQAAYGTFEAFGTLLRDENPGDISALRATETGQQFETLIERQLTTQLVQAQELDRLGWTATEQDVVNFIKRDEQFQVNGEFVPSLASAVLNTPSAEQRYFNQTRTRLNAERLSTFASTVAPTFAPQSLLNAAVTEQTRRYIVDTLIINASNQEVGEPTDELLQLLLEESQSRFQSQELRGFSGLFIDPNAFQLEADYAAYLAAPDAESEIRTFQLVNLLGTSEELVTSIFERASAGEDFAAVAEELVGQAPEASSSLRGDLSATIGDAIFGAGELGLVAPFKTDAGWAVANVTGMTQDKLDADAFAAQALEGDLEISADTRQRVSELVDTLNAAIFDGNEDLAALSELIEVPLLTIDGVNRFGRNADNQRVEELPAVPSLLSEVFAVEEAGSLGFLDTDEETGVAFIVKLDSIEPARDLTLDEARTRVEAVWRANEQIAAMEAKAEEWLVGLADGTLDLAMIAQEQGGEVTTSEPTGLLELSSLSVDPQVVRGMEVGEAAGLPLGSAYILYSLNDVVNLSAEEAELDLAELEESLTQSLVSPLNSTLLGAIEEAAGAKLDQEVWDGAIGAAVQTAQSAGFFTGSATQESIQRALSAQQARDSQADGNNGGGHGG